MKTYTQLNGIRDFFLSHLSGDEGHDGGDSSASRFLSHLSGDEETVTNTQTCFDFLSHLSGDEV